MALHTGDKIHGCTAQACSLRDGYAGLREAGYAIVGVSVDVEAFGVWQEKLIMNGNGRSLRTGA